MHDSVKMGNFGGRSLKPLGLAIQEGSYQTEHVKRRVLTRRIVWHPILNMRFVGKIVILKKRGFHLIYPEFRNFKGLDLNNH